MIVNEENDVKFMYEIVSSVPKKCCHFCQRKKRPAESHKVCPKLNTAMKEPEDAWSFTILQFHDSYVCVGKVV